MADSTQQKLQNLQRKLSKIYPLEIKLHLCSNAEFTHLNALNGNHLTYYRLFLTRFIKDKKALYLDVDMLVLKDLREIFAIDLEGKICGAVLDYKANRILEPKNKALPMLNLSKDYFNAGLLLIDLEKWKSQKLESKLIETLNQYHCKEHDQSALNVVLKDKIKILPLSWNTLVYYYVNAKACDDTKNFNLFYTRKDLNKALKNPHILHYYLGFKPWNDDKIYTDIKGEFLGEHWWNMVEKTPEFKDMIIPLKTKASKKAKLQVSLGYTLLTFARYKLYFLIPFYALLNSNSYKEIPKDYYNLSFEIGKEALKAKQKGRGRVWLLPFKVINLMKRFQLEKSLRESC
ncbi:glycosyltransferase family 8 protein [Helicobacter winghamensis]|uniref:Glycosyltransferase family 8 protein n=2 Tax=Helicobacter winghamensis TaxID=157268 RepID=A0A2N3PHJ1_9HELI|nr:glycosyltransferase family 8 protein [Helicobacter winghamensis]PKT75493.1 hypothetical protein BCM32_04710 [Helicobacter winghamensis]PKT79958.1 hypothetical protein BCM31_08270 [Helicobacter winghamensis]PKT80041.1 hypothetical protein BCM33_04540 [Helicobacter winghamensis]